MELTGTGGNSGATTSTYNSLEKFIAKSNPAMARKMYESRTKSKATTISTETKTSTGGTVPIATKENTETTVVKPKVIVTTPTNAIEQFVSKTNPILGKKMYEARTTPPAPPPVTTPAPTFQQYDNKMPLTEYKKYLESKLSTANATEDEYIRKLKEESANIDPTAKYIVKGSSDPLSKLLHRAGKDVILPGSAVINMYNKQIETAEIQGKDYISKLKAEKDYISKLDPNTLVSSTVRGMEFKIDTMADSRKQLATAEGLNKAIPGVGEGYKLLYGIWGSAVETGRGIYNLGVSAIDYILPGQGQNLRAVAESDITVGSGIFEQKMLGKDYSYKAVPSIWTGEGREILGELGTPGYIGAGLFEVGSFIVGGKAIEPIIGAGSKVVQFGSKKLLTTSLIRGTEETILEGGEKLIVPTSKGLIDYIPSAIKESKTLQTFEKWAVEGYKPGKALIEVPVQGGLKQSGGLSVQEFALKTDKSVGLLDRVWLSPAEQTEYASRLASQGTVEGSVTIRPFGKYSSRLTIATDKETFEKGLLGGIKGRTSTTFLKEDILGTELGTAKGGSRAYKITDLVQPIKDVGYKEVEHPFKEAMETGFSFKGKYYTGFGKQTEPLLEEAHWGARTPGILSKESFTVFIEDVRASASELVTIVKPTSLFSKTTRLASDVSFNVPSDVLGKGLTLGASDLLIGTIKTGKSSSRNKTTSVGMGELDINETDSLLINKLKFGDELRQDNIQKIDTVNKQDTGLLSDLFLGTGLISKTDTTQKQESLLDLDVKQDLLHEVVTKTELERKNIFDTTIYNKTIKKRPPFIPRKSDEEVEDKYFRSVRKERDLFKGTKKKASKTLVADLLSVTQSQARYGKSTQPKLTKAVWSAGEKTLFKRVPTQELQTGGKYKGLDLLGNKKNKGGKRRVRYY